jgi:predicted transposase YbfD/YdcC
MRIVTNKEAREETARRKLGWSLVQDVKRELQAQQVRQEIAGAEDIQDIKDILLYLAEQVTHENRSD